MKQNIIAWGLPIVATAGLMWLLGSSAGWYHALRLRAHVRSTQQAVDALLHERNRLIALVRQYQTHQASGGARRKRTVEQVAREQLQMGRPNEVVYR